MSKVNFDLESKLNKLRERENSMASSVESLQAANENDALDMIGNLKAKALELSPVKDTAKDNDETRISYQSKTLADSIIRRKTQPRAICANKTISKNMYKNPNTLKYSINMYDPATNYETLKNFFSVKLVKANKLVKPVCEPKSNLKVTKTTI